MSPELWRKVEELYHQASALDADRRARFLDGACAADSELRSEVESLLQRESKAIGFLEPSADTAMETSPPPAQVGPYRVSTWLGAGAMGDVYQAQDSKLGRDIALKLLKRDFASHPERLARFRREARLLASLNHPNIAAIYGIEESEGITCLVLELVEGASLRGPLPVKQALEYARQLAEALESAHGKGIVHRDLKPGNVKVTPQGRVKVLDFGLAKALRESDRRPDLALPTGATALETVAGVIVGTPAYMSPEQASGGAVDQRTDIWSFGCLLYELLTGKRAFGGDTLSQSLDAVRWREPDWAALPVKTPVAVSELIRRCLEKDVTRRVQKIAEARAVLEGAQRRPSSLPFMIAACLAVAVLAIWVLRPGRRVDARPSGSSAKPLTSYAGAELFPALSPDGRFIAFTWTGPKQGQIDLYTRPVDGEPPLRLTNDPALECYPAWSPDGTQIAFLHCDGLMGGIRTEAEAYVVGASGGPKRKVGKVLLQAYDNVNPLAWMPDGKHLVLRNRKRPQDQVGLFSLNIETGQMRQLTSPPLNYDDASPAVSHDGRMLAFVRQTTTQQGDIHVEDLSAGETSARRITHEQLRIYGIAWRSARELIYLPEEGTVRILWRIASDGSQREPLSSVGQVGVQFSLSRNGQRLAYSDAYINADIGRVNLMPAQHEGEPLPSETIIASTQWDGSPDYSPDGRSIAFASARSGQLEIWLADSDGSNSRQLTFLNRNTGTPRWSPRGDEIAVDSQRGEHTDIYVISVNSRRTRKITSEAGRNFLPSWSRDGKWIYFVSDRRDGYQVWKALAQAANGTESSIRVTKQGGFCGWESFDGKRFYYAKSSGPSSIWMVAAAGGQETEVIRPLNSWHYMAMFQDGIYYVPHTSSQIWFFSFADRQTRHVFDLQSGAGGIFAFSPDRKSLLVSEAESRGDLYLTDIN